MQMCTARRPKSSSMHLVKTQMIARSSLCQMHTSSLLQSTDLCECIFVQRNTFHVCASLSLSLLCCKDVCASCGCVVSSLSCSANEGSSKELRPEVCMCSHASLQPALLRLCVRSLAMALFHLKESERRLCEASLYNVAQSSV